MRFELFVRWNSKARIPIDGEASRFCDTDTEILCLRFYCDVVVLHFKSHCVYNRRGSNLFLMILPWKSGSRILIYILHAVVWMPTDRERGNESVHWEERHQSWSAAMRTPTQSWMADAKPEARCPTKVGAIEIFISSVFFNAFLIYGTLCGFVNCQLVSFMSASVGALCLGQLQRVGCLFFLGKGIAGTDKILLVEKKERWENQSCL